MKGQEERERERKKEREREREIERERERHPHTHTPTRARARPRKKNSSVNLATTKLYKHYSRPTQGRKGVVEERKARDSRRDGVEG